MTEYAYSSPDQAFQSPQERLVFVDPNDRHGREFEVQANQVVGADSPEVNQMVEDAYREAENARQQAAAETAEHEATDAELLQAVGWNAQAMYATREYEVNGS